MTKILTALTLAAGLTTSGLALADEPVTPPKPLVLHKAHAPRLKQVKPGHAPAPKAAAPTATPAP